MGQVHVPKVNQLGGSRSRISIDVFVNQGRGKIRGEELLDPIYPAHQLNELFEPIRELQRDIKISVSGEEFNSREEIK
jgi:hypothetical protein